MIQGRILKGVGGFYEVLCDGTVYTCRARGIFRKNKSKPLIGDYVEITPGSGEELSSVDAILPRKNELRRPAMANVDKVLLVTSVKDPVPDLGMVDRLLLYARNIDLDVSLLINKSDLAAPEEVEDIARQYRAAVSGVFAVSASAGLGLEELRRSMQGQCCCMAGQSGVGKTSLINALYPQFTLKTGLVSDRTSHGKHTTRHAELLLLPGDGVVADTPGFSLIEMDPLEPEMLPGLYPEFSPFATQCRFNGCMHQREPDCAVKDAVDKGLIAPERWKRYGEILTELKENWRNRYD